MMELHERENALRQLAIRVNAGRTPQFGDVMRNPWASKDNPRRDGMFVREKRVTGKCNRGIWYQFTDGRGNFWETSGDFAMFVDHLDAATELEAETI